MNLDIRPARPADLQALIDALGDGHFYADRLARQQHGLGILLTAWSGGEPVGGVYLWCQPADEPEIRDHLPGVPLINHLEVKPGRRNRGVGRRLVAAAETTLRDLGHDRVALGVAVDNHKAARLYTRLGYVDWTHSTVLCAAWETLPDGTRKQITEECHVLVKTLSR